MSFTSTLSTSTTCSILFFIFFSFTITPSHTARILLYDVADPPQAAFQHPTQPSITFIMQDMQPSTRSTIINPQQQQQQPPLPFSKPLGNIPSTFGGMPLPYQTSPYNHNTPRQAVLDMPSFGIVFPATSTLQEELEFGVVTNIEENIYVESSGIGPTLMGKAQGVYVAMSSSEDGSSHMMALTASFSSENGGDDKSNDEVDSLKFFGVLKRDVLECHVAVIGGTGKFREANGYGVISVVSRDKGSSDIQESSEEAKTMLKYNVYLS